MLTPGRTLKNMGTFELQHPLKVYLSDISPHNQAILEFFIGSTGGKTFSLAATAAEADVYITDFDYPGSIAHWETEHARSAKPCIALSIKDPDNPEIEWVPKPITAQALTIAAKKIAQQHITHDQGDSASSTPATAIPPRKTFKRPPSLPGLSGTPSPFIKRPRITTPAAHSPGLKQHANPVIIEVHHDNTHHNAGVAIAEKPATRPQKPEQTLHEQTDNKKLTGAKIKPAPATGEHPKSNEREDDQDNSQNKEKQQEQQKEHTDHQPLTGEQKQQRWKMLCGQHENTSHSKLQQDESLHYNGENHFLGTLIAGLRLAKQTKQVIQIKYEPHQFYVCYDEYLVFSPLHPQSDAFATLCFNKVKPGQINLHILSTPESADIRKRIHTDANFTYDLESFIWTSCLLTSQGRVPSSLDCEAPYLLKHWPNFTRIENFPFAMKIAARWQKKPYKVSDISREMNIPIRYVIAFYNGAAGLSLFETDPAQIEQKSNVEPRKNKGLIARLFGRLTKNEATD